MWGQLRSSVTAKALFIGFLVLVLLIPMGMVRGVIKERQSLYDAAKYSVRESWGRPQTLAAPVLTVPYRRTVVSDDNVQREVTRDVHVLPTEVHMVGNLESEVRYRGIHQVPVYVADFTISGRFDDLEFDDLAITDGTLQWQDAFVALPISDARPIKSDLLLNIGERSERFEPGGVRVQGFESQVLIPLKRFDFNTSTGPPQPFGFSYRLRLGGTDSIRFLPLGDSTSVDVKSGWPSPSFVGAHAPDQTRITDEGFEASWQVVHLGRGYASQWAEGKLEAATVSASGFGIDLFQPMGTYQAATRAAKYAVLFIGLSFVMFFLFEVLAQLRLHPMQYLLVGFANCIFYLLLVALSEHVSFAWAYLSSAAGSVAAIAGYCRATLGGAGRAGIMAGALTTLYGFLYVTLNQEDYAMLGGALLLFAALSGLMYMTRNIDWYSVQQNLPSAPAPD